jgi:lipopolysaccharide assembly outer membrane protein LptD (OstA)
MLANRDTQQEEYRAVWRHSNNDLPWGLKAVIDVNDYSDYEFFREFQRRERENTRSYLYSNAFVSGGWGPHSLSMIVDDRESFLGDGRSSNQRQLPEINYRLRKLKLGRAPLYLSLDTTASYFQTATPGLFDVKYGRFDIAPELTLPLRVAPWLSLAITAAGRSTWWGDSVPSTVIDPESGESRRMCGDRPAADDEVFCGESLQRNFPSARVEAVGPSFSKIFDSPGGRFSKLKHLIEPRISYGYVGEFEDQDRVPRFDQIDSFSSNELAQVAIVNRVLAKPSDEEQGGAFEIFSFEIAQAFSMRDDQPLQRSADGSLTSKESAIFATLRYRPSRVLDLKARATYSTLFSGLESTSLSARAKGSRAGVDLTWYTNYNAETSDKRSDQARLGLDLALVPQRLSIGGQVNYDLISSEVLQQVVWLSYQSQCWSFILEAREQVTSTYQARDYRFLLNLKNVGTFLDLNGGNSTARF